MKITKSAFSDFALPILAVTMVGNLASLSYLPDLIEATPTARAV
jgi:hypothetical protein